MRNDIRRVKWLKREVLFRAFASLCVLAIFVPELTQAIPSKSAPASISPYSKTYAVLPAHASGIDKLQRDRRNFDCPRKAIPATNAATLWEQRYLPPPGTVSERITQFDVVLNKWRRASCQLLDIPPPLRA